MTSGSSEWPSIHNLPFASQNCCHSDSLGAPISCSLLLDAVSFAYNLVIVMAVLEYFSKLHARFGTRRRQLLE